MSEFDKAVDKLAENIKTPEQIISKRTLADLIDKTDELYREMCHSTEIESGLWRGVVIDNLRELRKINQRLGYE